MQSTRSSAPGPLNKKEELLDGSVDDNSITNNQLNADPPAEDAPATVENNFAKEEEKSDSNFPKSEENKEEILGFEEVSDAVY